MSSLFDLEIGEKQYSVNSSPLENENLRRSLEKHYRYGEDWITRYLHRQRINYITEVIHNCSQDTGIVLDVGCGSGIYVMLLASQNLLTIGVDVSRESLAVAKEWSVELGVAKYVHFIRCDAEFLPLRNAIFDFIVCSEVIEHLDIPEYGLKEISRVIDPKGCAIITLPNLFSYYWMRFSFSYSILQFLGRGQDTLAEKHTSFPVWRTLRLLKKNNLLIVNITSTNIIPLPFSLWRRLINFYPHIIKLFERIEGGLAAKTPFKYLGSSIIVLATRSMHEQNCL